MNSGTTIIFVFEYSTLACLFHALAEKLLGLYKLDIFACKAWFSNKLETSRFPFLARSGEKYFSNSRSLMQKFLGHMESFQMLIWQLWGCFHHGEVGLNTSAVFFVFQLLVCLANHDWIFLPCQCLEVTTQLFWGCFVLVVAVVNIVVVVLIVFVAILNGFSYMVNKSFMSKPTIVLRLWQFLTPIISKCISSNLLIQFKYVLCDYCSNLIN